MAANCCNISCMILIVVIIIVLVFVAICYVVKSRPTSVSVRDLRQNPNNRRGRERPGAPALGSGPDHYFNIGNMEMWLGQDSLSNSIRPERLSPPPSLVSDFEELHTGKPFTPEPNARADSLCVRRVKTFIYRRTSTACGEPRRQNAPFSSCDEILFHLGKT